MIKNKKSMSLHVYMLVIAFFLGLVSFFVSLYLEAKQIDNYIGEYQIQIQKAANEGDKILFYIQQSANLAFGDSVQKLAKNAGVSEIDEYSDDHAYYECGKYKDSYVWFEVSKDNGQFAEKECFNEIVIGANFENEFNEKLNHYLEIYPKDIPIDNFEFTFIDTAVIAKAIHPIEIDILKKDKIYEIETAEIEDADIKTETENYKAPKTVLGIIDFSDAPFCSKGTSCSLKEDAYSLLEKSQQNAIKKGISLEVTSSYRSKEQQIAIWEGKTSSRYAQRYPDPAIRGKYVCYPYGDVQDCPHLTGNAIDVKLNGKEMSSSEWKTLEDIMTDSGWVRYEKEPWHFECCGTKRFARARAKAVDVIS